MSEINTSDKPRMLITGFGPFPGVPENPSAHLVAMLKASAGWEQLPVQPLFMVLPTDWDKSIEALTNAYRTTLPSIVIQFGYSESAIGLQLEAQASNTCASRRDSAGNYAPSNPAHVGRPAVLQTAFPIAPIKQALAANNIPAAPSKDAGHFICNYAYYSALNWFARHNAPPYALFTHMPGVMTPRGALPSKTQNTAARRFMTQEQIFKGARVIIAQCAQQISKIPHCRKSAAKAG